jgi:hypothetical protein
MRRHHRSTTKVWHNPDILPPSAARGRVGNGASIAASTASAPSAGASSGGARAHAAERPARSSRIVAAAGPDASPHEAERRRLVARLLAADAPSQVVAALTALESAGFEIPRDEDVQLALLDHPNELVVQRAIAALASLYEAAPPKRPSMAESRLRRAASRVEHAATRDDAERLRQVVAARAVPSPEPSRRPRGDR